LIRWNVGIDVFGFVNFPCTNPNRGWCIQDQFEDSTGSANNKCSYASTENNTAFDKTKGPVLLIYYTAGNPAPTPCSTNHPPVAVCQNVTVSAGANCTANASINNGSCDPDSGSGDTITHSQSPAGPYSVGNTPVTLTVTDSHGATASCSATVTVVDDTPPSISCPANITVNNESGLCGAHVPFTAPVGTDNCSGATTEQTAGLASGALFPVGTTTNTFKVTDDAGHTATCSFTVTVVDNEKPVITQCAMDRTITAPCFPASTPVPDLRGQVSATDNCGGPLTVTQTPAAGTPLVLGDTTVTLTVTDAAGNYKTCTAHLYVNYNFTGFFQPVDNIPTFNRVKAGSAIPVKFSLGCNQGLNILAAGFPQSGLVACDTHEPVDDVETTVNAGNSSLNYDATTNQYIYVWKTDKAWGGTCRVLNVRLADGTSHYAYFNFTR
jgi:hypothetical protein